MIPKVIDLVSRSAVLEINNVDNRSYPEALSRFIKTEIQKELESLDRDQLKADPIIQGFWDLHKSIGLPKRSNTPAPLTLLKLILKRGVLFSIDPVVDLYNLVSIQSRLALGAHDIDRIDGDVELKITNGTERFVPIGANGSAEKIKAGEYSYVDASNEVICHLETRQVEKTKVTAGSTHIFYIVQGNEHTSQEY
ncbi:tRNA ligase, partial [Oenococcus alcoholitolerans]